MGANSRRVSATRVSIVGLIALPAALTGCGESLPTVEGNVTIGGKPLAGGFVSFMPTDGGAMGTAKIDSNGSYSLKTGGQGGLKTGHYRVTVTAYKTRKSPDGQEAPQYALATPKKYNDPETSGLEAQVEPGRNEFDFELAEQ